MKKLIGMFAVLVAVFATVALWPQPPHDAEALSGTVTVRPYIEAENGIYVVDGVALAVPTNHANDTIQFVPTNEAWEWRVTVIADTSAAQLTDSIYVDARGASSTSHYAVWLWPATGTPTGGDVAGQSTGWVRYKSDSITVVTARATRHYDVRVKIETLRKTR